MAKSVTKMSRGELEHKSLFGYKLGVWKLHKAFLSGVVTFCTVVSFVVLFLLSLDAHAQRYEWEESSLYIKPQLGMIMLGKVSAELRPISQDSDKFDYKQDGYGYFPSIIGIALERKIIKDLFIEIEAGFFRNYDVGELSSDKESHALIAVGPIFRFSNESRLITPFVSLSLGSLYSQYNSSNIVQEEVASVIDEVASFLGQVGAGVDFGYFEDIDFGIGYKFMFIGSQGDLEIFGLDNQTLHFGPRIGHRFEGTIRIGTNVF